MAEELIENDCCLLSPLLANRGMTAIWIMSATVSHGVSRGAVR